MINPFDQIVVRQAESDAEIDAFYQVSILAFSGGPALEAAVRQERSNHESDRDFDPRQRRVAIRDGSVVGGYYLFDRWLRIGSSYLSTGCIGGVATHPDHQRQGVGLALMGDAIAESDERQHAMLLLSGIPNYYHRFGYADVLDITDQVIDRTAVPAEAPDGFTVRPATAADGPILLAIRERHYHHYTGCFTRTLDQQQARLKQSLDRDNPPIIAFDADGNPRGYLILRRGDSRTRAVEVATDTWPAAAALLRHHSEVVASQGDSASEITWPLPPDSPTVYQLADNLRVANPSFGFSPRGWSVRSQTYQHPSAGWQGRSVSVRRTAESLRPVWHSRLARASLSWAGVFVLGVGGEAVAIEIGDETVEVLEAFPADAPVVTITPERFIQLVWGFRLVSYVASQPGSVIPREIIPVLEALFPTSHAWILASDGF